MILPRSSFPRRRASRVLRATALCILLSACDRGTPPPAPARAPLYEEAASSSGIDFVHSSGFDGVHYRIAETVTGGVAILDFDQDGWMDIYLTCARRLDAPPDQPRNALYRSLGDGKFQSVGEAAGVADSSFSLGCAVADYDGNGFPDLLVTNWGKNRLYRNLGDGTFEDVAERMGLTDEGIHSGAAFLDVDSDGDLDLYVASYVIDDPVEKTPIIVRGFPGYRPPRNYEPAPHRLYRNVDGERFEDVSESSGIRGVIEPGRGLGVLAQDLNADGWQDLYVANDMSANFLFLGDGAGHFREVGFVSGVAFDDDGSPLGSMGVDAADYDGDGLVDICVSNYYAQVNNLYRRVGEDRYEEMARVAGVSTSSLTNVAWGIGFIDADNDGRQDLFIVNGHLNPHAEQMDAGARHAQLSRLFMNRGGARFEDMTAFAGAALQSPRVGRGAAFGDMDNDGDVDIVVSTADGRPELLLNRSGNSAAWCEVLLRARGRNSDAVGAQVTLSAGGQKQMRFRRSSGSYLSANDPRLHFGLGSATRIEMLEVRWPDGAIERHEDLPAHRLVLLEHGKPPVVRPLPARP